MYKRQRQNELEQLRTKRIRKEQEYIEQMSKADVYKRQELTQAVNTLTQRMSYPSCAAEVTVDASALKEGDVAGLCALQGCYCLLYTSRCV